MNKKGFKFEEVFTPKLCVRNLNHKKKSKDFWDFFLIFFSEFFGTFLGVRGFYE